MKISGLKDCPFCGKQPKVRYESDKIGYYIECDCQIHYKCWNLNEAIKRWNRRVGENE